MKHFNEEIDNTWSFNKEAFLKNCKLSSAKTYENLKEILKYLDNSATRVKARCALAELNQHFNSLDSSHDALSKYHFSIDKLITDGNEASSNTLLLLQLPSIFTPEDWSFTFYEGLARYPSAAFHHRTISELGCGNGWISIALAKKCYPQQIYGLDINPKAIVCARINLYLNALDDQGQPIVDSEGKSILDRIQFHVSDLLEFCLANKIKLDKVIGCIPQVLAPDSNLLPNIIPENATDESLYALSNYCSKQGYIEDQFGLGLIARAVEESLEAMKPSGKIILNLGGRPGKAVLDRLLTRRGFKVTNIWQTKIEQASDTEIAPLVEIEKNSSYRFEFYMGVNSSDSISARTAYAYSQSGGKIFHSLQVVEAEMRDNLKMKKILRLLMKEEYSDARSALDLTYQDRSLVEEKISFLSRLSERLSLDSAFNYADVQGESSFRRHIAEFFRTYWRIPVTAKSVLIAPSRVCAIKNIFSIYDVKKAIVDKEICKELPSEWIQAEINENSDKKIVIEAPKQCELICKLISTIKPQLVVCALGDYEIRQQDSFRRLIDTTEKIGTRLVIDISNAFELSSTPRVNGVFEYLSEQALPEHVSLICGFIHNRLYTDLEVTFLLSENESLLNAFCNAAEITFSRASIILQEYYNTILFDLLNFHVRNNRRGKFQTLRLPNLESTSFQNRFPAFSKNYLDAYEHSAIRNSHHEISIANKNTVRLDRGENRFSSPNVLKSAIFEGFSRQNISKSEVNLKQEIAFLIEKRFGIKSAKSENIFIGNGLTPLFSGICEYIALYNQSILFPTGSYGYFVASAQFHGTPIIHLQTSDENNFKITPYKLNEILAQQKKTVFGFFLNAPIVNPTGAMYTLNELGEIFKVAEKYNAVVILDSIFSGLEYNYLEAGYNIFSILKHFSPDLKYLLLGGLSKELAAGGLRIGFGYTEQVTLRNALARGAIVSIPTTVKYAVRKVYSLINKQNKDILKHFLEQRNFLANRAQKLSQTLKTNGWEPLTSHGGLFLIAKPTKLIGKKVRLNIENEEMSMVLSEKNIHEALFYKTDLLINGCEWTGIPGYCRFVLSVTDQEFESAIEKLRLFWNAVITEEKWES